MSSNVLNEEMRITWNKVYASIYDKDVGEYLTNEELKTLYEDITTSAKNLLGGKFTGKGIPGLSSTL